MTKKKFRSRKKKNNVGHRSSLLKTLAFFFASMLLVSAIVVLYYHEQPKPEIPVFSPPSSSLAEEAASSLPDEAAEDLRDEWYMALVNSGSPLPVDYKITLASIGDSGFFFDARAIYYLLRMLEDCEAAGFSPLVAGAYRSLEDQQLVFEERVRQLRSQGVTNAEADLRAHHENMAPGQNEHNLGLAVDIVSAYGQGMNDSVLKEPEYSWLVEKAPEYGFIQRYTVDKEEITGVAFEPWHFRFVGIEQAQLIAANGLSLEEYLELL